MTESPSKYKGRGLMRAASTLMIGHGLSAGLSFLLTALLARFLTPADFTSYTLVLAWLFPAILIAEFGLSTLFLREVSVEPTLTRPLLQHLLTLRLALSGGVAVCFVGGLWLGSVGLSLAHLLIASPLLFVQPLFNLMSAALRARSWMSWVAGLNVGMLMAQSGVLLLRPTWRADEALLLNTLTSVGQLCAAVWVVWRATRKDVPHTAPFLFYPLAWLRRCLPFAVASALGAIQARLTLLLVDQQFTPAQTAAYIVASRFAEAARLPLMAFFDALYPRLSAAAAHGSLRALRQVLVRAAVGYASFAGLALQGAGFVILLVFPSAYWGAVPLLPAASVAFLVSALHAAANLYCYAVGHEALANQMTLATIASLVVVASLVQWPSISDFLLAAATVEAFITATLVLRITRLSQRVATTPPYTPAG